MNPIATHLNFSRLDIATLGDWGQQERGTWESEAFETLFDSTLQATSPSRLNQQQTSPAFQSTERMTTQESIFPSTFDRPGNLSVRQELHASLPPRDLPRALSTHTPMQAYGWKAGVIVPGAEPSEPTLTTPQEARHSSRSQHTPYQVPDQVIVAVVSAANVLSISIRDASLNRARYTQLQDRLQLELSWQSIALGSLSLNGYQETVGTTFGRSSEKAASNTSGA